ncbi:ABC transporter permease [Aliiruegeria lutimaris]|uniref:NitT/TauT family transport system permease protein n=1 Tax=Aliiruegeria lutimaris TaxID=571298 RepID=A0A1G8U3W9_9RHOB|nr:NitT/TauT family transport system permease protein [Aliiruegeria lutimaris]
MKWAADRSGSIAVTATSILAMVLGWWALALINGDPTVLPGPWRVLPLVGAELASGDLIHHLAATLRRVALAFVIAMSVGIAVGLLMGSNQGADQWLDPWLIAFLNLPALVTIVLCYLWIGLNEVAAVTAVAINKIPTVVVTIREGTRALDRQLSDVATVFRMSRWIRFRHVVLPQLGPYIASAGRSGISLIWKIVLVVEFLGRSDGIGFKIHLYFQLFDVGMVLAYALSFVVVMLVIEALFLRPWEAHAARWRHA